MDETNLGLVKRGITKKSQLSQVPKCAGIYSLKWQNGNFYIGKSKNLRNRFAGYFYRGHHNQWAKRLTKKYGNPIMTVLAVTQSVDGLSELENHYINLFFEDPQNINFCRAKEYRKVEYGPSELKQRHKTTVWASNAWLYAPVQFKGWAPLRNILDSNYKGNMYRREMVFATNKTNLRKEYNRKQRDWINRPHHYNNGAGRSWFVFEGKTFATAVEAWEYSLLPVKFSYYQRFCFDSYASYLRKSIDRSSNLIFDGLIFYGARHLHAYLKNNVMISYNWLLRYYESGADTTAKIMQLQDRPRNRGPEKMRHLFIKNFINDVCISCYLVVHDGKRWYPSINEAKRHNAKTLNFYYED